MRRTNEPIFNEATLIESLAYNINQLQEIEVTELVKKLSIALSQFIKSTIEQAQNNSSSSALPSDVVDSMNLDQIAENLEIIARNNKMVELVTALSFERRANLTKAIALQRATDVAQPVQQNMGNHTTTSTYVPISSGHGCQSQKQTQNQQSSQQTTIETTTNPDGTSTTTTTMSQGQQQGQQQSQQQGYCCGPNCSCDACCTKLSQCATALGDCASTIGRGIANCFGGLFNGCSKCKKSACTCAADCCKNMPDLSCNKCGETVCCCCDIIKALMR